MKNEQQKTKEEKEMEHLLFEYHDYKGKLTFHSAVNTHWKKSADFKSGTRPRYYEARWDLIRALEGFLTEEERKTKKLYEIESRLIEFVENELPKQLDTICNSKDVYKNNLDICYFCLMTALDDFISCVNKIQTKRKQPRILSDLYNIVHE